MTEPVRGGFPEPGFYSLPGIDQARAYLRRLVPRTPLSHLLGIRVTQVGSGAATCTMPASPWVQSLGGPLIFGSLMDAASSMAVLSGAPPGSEIRTVAISATSFRPATVASETLIARARTVSTGARFIFTEVLLEDGLGREVCRASAAAAVRPLESSPPPIELGAPVEPIRYPTPDPYQRPLPMGDFPSEAWQRHDGLSIMRMLAAGELPLPPVAELLGVHVSGVEPGRAALTMPASEWLCDRSRGQAATGVLSDLLVLALNGAALTVVPVGGGRPAALYQNLNLIRSVVADGKELRAEARVTEREAEFVVTAAVLTDPQGRRVAIAQQTSLFVGAVPRVAYQRRRGLLTLLFTDLVRSTETAEELRDERWGELLAQHHGVIRRALEVHHGWEVKTTGDGFLATFDSPADALDCARRIREGVQALGLAVRMGVHTGQCDVGEGDVAGIAVHVAARVLAAAGPGEILVSSTVRDLVLGSDVKFEDRGRQELKGIEGEWRLLALAD